MSLCNPDWRDSTWAFYRYVPSVAPAVIFCILFLASSVLHFWQMYTTRTWFLTALVAGCFKIGLTFAFGRSAEFIGYAARASSARQEPGCWSMMPFIIQDVFILLSPALFSASIYVLLGKIIRLTNGESYTFLKGRSITKVFVTGDLVCLFMQCIAGGLTGGARALPILAKIGNGVIIASLILQLVWFAFFVVVAFMFHRAMRLVPTESANRPDIRWETYLFNLYFVSLLIMIRSLARAIEFIQGSSSPIQRFEVLFYIFDAVLMLISVLYLHWKHPSEIGLLLRGEEPCTNGLQLFKVKPQVEAFTQVQSFVKGLKESRSERLR